MTKEPPRPAPTGTIDLANQPGMVALRARKEQLVAKDEAVTAAIARLELIGKTGNYGDSGLADKVIEDFLSKLGYDNVVQAWKKAGTL